MTYFQDRWHDAVSNPPHVAGTFIVAEWRSEARGVARWMPRARRWVFPSAASRFEPTHWRPMPPAPEPPK